MCQYQLLFHGENRNEQIQQTSTARVGKTSKGNTDKGRPALHGAHLTTVHGFNRVDGLLMIKHPAKYTNVLLPVFERILSTYNCINVLDCFAGTGKIHSLPFNTTGLELEPEWASQSSGTIVGDATKMPFADESFCAICTSPTYGNRMADSHEAKDKSVRNTYTHKIGRKLSDNNSGAMQWGDKYRVMHQQAWSECFRVLKHGGVLILNFKNHIRKGAEVDVFGWHVQELIRIGFTLRSVEQIMVNGNGFGQNGTLRIPFEYVATFEKV